MYDHLVKGRNPRVYAAVQPVPRGRVATYGQVADLAGLGKMARQVGYALYALPEHAAVPWHRVVNARGDENVIRCTFACNIPRPSQPRIRVVESGIRNFGPDAVCRSRELCPGSDGQIARLRRG